MTASSTPQVSRTRALAQTSRPGAADSATRAQVHPAILFAERREPFTSARDTDPNQTGVRPAVNIECVQRAWTPCVSATPIRSIPDPRSSRYVVTAPATQSRIVCRHAGLNARTALDETLRVRVRETLIDFFRATFDRSCVDRNRTTSTAAAIAKEKFFLAASPRAGGINHGTVRSDTTPRGRSGSTFQSRGLQEVRHRRGSDSVGAGTSTTPSRSDFPSEGQRSSEEHIADQGGPQ